MYITGCSHYSIVFARRKLEEACHEHLFKVRWPNGTDGIRRRSCSATSVCRAWTAMPWHGPFARMKSSRSVHRGLDRVRPAGGSGRVAEAGFDRHVAKPVEMEMLERMLA